MHFLPINLSWVYVTRDNDPFTTIIKNPIFLRTKKHLQRISCGFLNKIVSIFTLFKYNYTVLKKGHTFCYIFLDIINIQIFLYFSSIDLLLLLLNFIGKIFDFL